MKTTILGIVTIIAALANAAATYLKSGSADFSVLIGAISAGIGLIKAADAPVKPL